MPRFYIKSLIVIVIINALSIIFIARVLLESNTEKSYMETITQAILQNELNNLNNLNSQYDQNSSTTVGSSSSNFLMPTVALPKICPCRSKGRYRHAVLSMQHLMQKDPETLRSGYVQLKKRHPNIPIDLQYNVRTACNLLPDITEIQWAADTWQQIKLDNVTTLYLYSAIFDNRTDTAKRPLIRVLGLVHGKIPSTLYAQIWFGAKGPVIPTTMHRSDHIDYQTQSSSRLMPLLFSFSIPRRYRKIKPEAVSVVNLPCEKPTNVLKIVGAGVRNHTTALKKVTFIDTALKGNASNTQKTIWSVAACGPGLYYFSSDVSKSLVEWLEMLRITGISQVFLYVTSGLHPNIRKVLNYYELTRFVNIKSFDYPPPYVNHPILKHLWRDLRREEMFALENVYYTDCVLRNMHNYRFLIHVDPDEYISLTNSDDIAKVVNYYLLNQNKTRLPASYRLQWGNYYDNVGGDSSPKDVPIYHSILRHNIRNKVFNNSGNINLAKCIYDTDLTTGVFSHAVLRCNNGYCRNWSVSISPRHAFIGHIKKQCDTACQNIKKYHKETFKNIKGKLVSAVRRRFQKLQIN